MMIEALFTYYYSFLTFKSSVSRYYYYFKYSCLKTLAAREKSSIRQVIMRYGLKSKVTYKQKTKKTRLEKK